MKIPIDSRWPAPRQIGRAVEILKKGGVIAYPTDTIYGIGCDLFQKPGIERIYRLKGRDKHKPLSFICKDLSDVSRYARVDDAVFRLLRRLLPGPYTFILPASSIVPKIMLTRRETVGVRVPDNAICQALVAALGNPIISTSANLKGDEQVISDPDDIEDTIGHALDAVLDGGPLPSLASSVVDLSGPAPVVLRKGLGDVSFFE